MTVVVRFVPLVLGLVVGFLALAIGGIGALRWFIVGVFFGGWVPLYLIPWLRKTLR